MLSYPHYHIHTMSISNDVQALRYLPSVRERCSEVYKLAQEGKVDSFTLDETRYDAVVDLCAKAINVRSASSMILTVHH
jgi:hypothetical protein